MNISRRDDYNSSHKCTWCPGCGNYTIWYMLKEALLELQIDPNKVVIIYDIGCNGNGANFLKTYGFHGLHGRSLPVAQAIKLVNPGVKVIAIGGDGGGLGLGVGHFIHACRRNIDITYIMHDNQTYGLTTGQASPRTDKGAITKTTPTGNIEDPINPVSLAIASNASFVARGYSGSPHILKEVLKKGISHKGFAFIDILQPCITFNKLNTYAWYSMRTYDVSTDNEFNFTNKESAFAKSLEWDSKIPLGILYFREDTEFIDRMARYNKPDIFIAKPVNIAASLKKYKVE